MSSGLGFFLNLLVNGIVVGALYALVALGFVLIYKASGVINLAQGELVLLGAYIGLTFTTELNLPFALALLLTIAVSALVGVAIERAVLRPFIGEPPISIIMVTMGLSFLIKAVIHGIWGTDMRSFQGLFRSEPIVIGPVAISEVFLWGLVAALILLVLLNAFFKYSLLGIAMRATADDEQAALSMGISVKRVLAATWAVAAMVAAVGGIFLGNIAGVNPLLTSYGLKVLPVAILGGLDSIPGAILGGFLIGILEALTGGYLDQYLTGIKEVVPFVVMIVILLIRPYGLFGKEIIERV
ncbi:branched-chain amino acid ABC transporter permease [Symbiobacterium thermophilum]|uniref:Branched-chain amino acid ABC transporter permease protein n=1 Tax=Symbiobacterium thermophilum (strain DSM 24528 / JCM 14929 / IAM 14863 / T) TaxID=292459 RepID=Q67RK3_SYMTH|nr:branched-chain amino acid ABC transporter permease [Symbiobacterium thermophilum]BAD39690.1 branched-chain amino acid ABC transporter permease protein [Symbiobacterium thermophilum IAM 14863]